MSNHLDFDTTNCYVTVSLTHLLPYRKIHKSQLIKMLENLNTDFLSHVSIVYVPSVSEKKCTV